MQPGLGITHLLKLYMFKEKSTEPIRVVFMDHTAQLGGGEIALRNLLYRLDSDRVHIEVILFADGPLTEQLRARHSVHVLPLSRQINETRKGSLGWKGLLRLGDALLVLRYTWRLSRYMRRLKAQIVHTNSLKAHVIGGIAARLAGLPLVWHLRDRIAPDYLPSAAVRAVRILGRILPGVIIANSQATLSTIVGPSAKSGPSKRTTTVVHDGCELPLAVRCSNLEGPAMLGLIGRISPWKGQHVFIRAAAIVREEFPNARFQIIGAPLFSETAYEDELKTLVRDLRLEEQVEFVGFVTDVSEAMAQLQIVVHASTIGEPFGQVVIEGMAAGKPVIATRGGGIPEIVDDKVTGLLVPMGDERALAEAMVALLRDPESAAMMGLRGRERVRAFFTIERTAKAVEQVYRDIVRRNRSEFEPRESVIGKRLDQEL